VLKYAARNENLEVYEIGVAKSTYDNYCSGESIKDSSSTDIGIEAVIKLCR